MSQETDAAGVLFGASCRRRLVLERATSSTIQGCAGEDGLLQANKDEKEVEADHVVAADLQLRTHGKKQGTFMGVYLPVVASMWGVLIFIRFGVIVGYMGWGLSVGFVFLAAFSQALTTLSLCAVLSNTSNYKGGTFGILKRNLGGEMAGVICLLYYLGMTTLASVELLGSVQAIDYILTETTSYNGTSLVGSQYWDQVVLGAPLLVCLVFIRAFDVKYVHSITAFILCVVLCGFFFGFLGQFMTIGSWRGTVGDIEGVTGLNWQTFMDNAGQNYSHPEFNETYLENVIGSTSEAVTENAVEGAGAGLSIIFPMFLGIFQGANKAADLKSPNKNIPKGTFLAIFTSVVVYCTFFLLLAAVAVRDILKTDFLLFDNLTYPTHYIGLVATVLVGIGACVELLEIGPTILQAVADDGLYSFLKTMRLEKMGRTGEPIYAVSVSFVINFALLFVASKYFEFLATVVTMLFLQAYFFMHVAVLLNEFLHPPAWRPAFKYYHWTSAVLGAVTCIVLMFYINYIISLITISCATLLLLMAKFHGEPRREGLSTRMLRLGRALRFILSDELITNRELLREHGMGDGEVDADGEPEPSWIPQILLVCRKPRDLTKEDDYLKIMHLAQQLNDPGVYPYLTIVASVVPHSDMKTFREVRDTNHLRLFSLSQAANLASFPQVVMTREDSSLTGVFQVMAQSVGIGHLKPNVLMMSFSDEDVWNIVFNCNLTKVCMVYKDIKPMVHVHEGTRKAIPDIVIQNSPHPEAAEVCARDEEESESDIEADDVEDEMNVNAFNLDSLYFNKWQRKKKANLKARSGDVHVWWILKNGGLPILISKLLMRSRVWRNCKITIFTTIEGENISDIDTVQATLQVERMLKSMRVDAIVEVIQVSPKTRRIVRDTKMQASSRSLKDSHLERLESIRMSSRNLVNNPAEIKGDTLGVLDEETEYIEQQETLRKRGANLGSKLRKLPTVADLFPDNFANKAKQKSPDDLAEDAVQMYKQLLEQYSKTAELVVLNLPFKQKEFDHSKVGKRVERLVENLERVLFVHLPGDDEDIKQAQKKMNILKSKHYEERHTY
uniref:Amino acid permease/ SLC12A domain-containing protein n=1 Tax=Mucochytrium quahogii TaxID=96639 RepID=A0A7S2WTR2_9STRA|mmetsp:Transcript_9824/g.18447  ORF Transcript_9824/g.18447 Transcript_9824/m.18447 type:complete len:1068 (+) Transcript_9824:408-3611(+)